jgi:hypothetical protein
MKENDNENKTEKRKAEKHEKHAYMEHHEHKKHQAYKTATWVLAIVCVALLAGLIVALAVGGKSPGTGKELTPAEAQAKTEAYLKTLVQGQSVSIDSVTDVGDLYQIKLTVAGKQYDSYVRKDGSILFPQGVDMTQPVAASDTQATQPTVVPQTGKPAVELFVMAYCPYGTQAEKGILPAVKALGNKIDFKVRFVYYAMHGQKEVQENLRQYCIQKDQPTVFEKYLACFLNASDSPGCLASTGVDTAKLDACTAVADTQFKVTANFNDQSSWLSGQYPKFDIDAALNTQYGVQGSPTLVINGVQSNAGRDPASFLAGICAAFNNAPAECQTQLSSTSPGPGFGYDSTSAATAAGCGV